MDATIQRLMELAEPARPEKFRRYLGTLTTGEMAKKLAAMEADAQKVHVPNWQGRRSETRIS